VADRESDRSKQRAPFTVTLNGRRHNGLLLDISRTGLFIQTSAKPEPGTRLDIEVVLDGKPVSMLVEVTRRKQVPAQLLTVAHGGIGVRILSTGEEFFQLLANIQGTGDKEKSRRSKGRGSKPAARPDRIRSKPAQADSGAAPKPAAEAPPGAKEFRVRVRLGSRTRTLKVTAADEAAARVGVCEDLGEAWKILEVTPG
jgi:hypothetical protein